MKLLLLVCFLVSYASAEFQQEADQAIDESVLAFLQGSVQSGSLSEALGVNDPEMEQMADDLEIGLGQKVREALKEMLEKIKDHVENGKAVGHELVEKVKELRDRVKELGKEDSEKVKEMLKNIREKAKEALKNILERLGLGKRNLDDSMDHVARMRYSSVIDEIREKIVSEDNIQKIRDYIRNHPGTNPWVKALQALLPTLTDDELRRVLSDLLEHRSGPHHSLQMRGETWDKVKDFFKGLNIKIQEHSKKFGEWVKEKWGKGIDKMKDKYGTIKAIAMEFIANSKDMSAEMSREALEFFRPYKQDLGSLWNKLVEATKEAIGRF